MGGWARIASQVCFHILTKETKKRRRTLQRGGLPGPGEGLFPINLIGQSPISESDHQSSSLAEGEFLESFASLQETFLEDLLTTLSTLYPIPI